MGLLEGLLGAAMGALNTSGQQQASPMGGAGGALLNIALEMLANRGQGAAAGGGVGGLLQSLSQGGLGDVVQSWISTGSNLPISAEQLQQVLGNEQIGQIAQRLGLPSGAVADQLSQVLPEVVDKLTPAGELPASGMGDPQELLASLTRALRG